METEGIKKQTTQINRDLCCLIGQPITKQTEEILYCFDPADSLFGGSDY